MAIKPARTLYESQRVRHLIALITILFKHLLVIVVVSVWCDMFFPKMLLELIKAHDKEGRLEI